MLHAEPVRYNRPDGAGLCADGDSGLWTGEKRRKQLRPLPPVADTRISSSCSSDGPGGQEKPKYIIYKAPWEKEEPDLVGKVEDEEFLAFQDVLSKRTKMRVTRCNLEPEQQRQVYERLVLYGIRAQKLSKGESKDKLGDEALRKELPYFFRQELPLCDLEFHVDDYFCSIEIEGGDPVDWYFDSDYAKFRDLDDYQRLVIADVTTDEDYEYQTCDVFHSKLTTFEMDKDYVEFFREISSKLKWLKPYLGLPEKSLEWSNIYKKGLRQAMKIAAGPESNYPHLTIELVYTAYEDHIWSLRSDYCFRQDMDRLFFEIWKRTTSSQYTFAGALKAVLDENLVPQHQRYMRNALEHSSLSDLEERYNSCLKGIEPNASEEVAKDFIIRAVLKHHKVKKMLHNYMERKMEVAQRLGLVK